MERVDTLVIGAGQAGLATSRSLTDAGIDHVVVERGRLGERWRNERWDSLRLLTPNWATRLPGWRYDGADPDGFMTSGELVTYFEDYAASFAAPVHEGTAVRSVEPLCDGYVVRADDTTWRAENVVIATGWCDRPLVPSFAGALDRGVVQLTPSSYRNPGALPDGGVLVVGASASGAQLADELARSGRDVVLAVGRHSRVPRRYRGRDIWGWLEDVGTFAKTIDDVPDPDRARREGSMQLIGRDDGRGVDLGSLQALGVRLTGRLTSVDGAGLRFADDLSETSAASDQRLRRVLGGIDAHISASALQHVVPPAEPLAPVRLPPAVDRIDVRAAGIGTVVWATGFSRSYPWLHVPVLDRRGELVHRRGVTPNPGLYVVGLRFQHRRDANFIDGVRYDAAFVTAQIASRLHRRRHAAA